MLVRSHGFALDRGEAVALDVELDLRAGLPGLAVLGLGSGSARDLRERVQAAVLNSGYGFPRRRVTVNVAPAPRRCGAELDLAVACCVLAAAGQLASASLERVGLCGELGLGGELRASGLGAAVADAGAAAGLAGVVLAAGDRDDAANAGALPVVGAESLRQVVTLLAERRRATGASARVVPALEVPRRRAIPGRAR